MLQKQCLSKLLIQVYNLFTVPHNSRDMKRKLYFHRMMYWPLLHNTIQEVLISILFFNKSYNFRLLPKQPWIEGQSQCIVLCLSLNIQTMISHEGIGCLIICVKHFKCLIYSLQQLLDKDSDLGWWESFIINFMKT